MLRGLAGLAMLVATVVVGYYAYTAWSANANTCQEACIGAGYAAGKAERPSPLVCTCYPRVGAAVILTP